MTAADHPATAATGAASATGVARRRASAVSGLSTVLAGTVLWSGAMAASALAGLLARGWQTPSSMAAVAALFAAGAAVAFPLAYAATRLAGGRRAERRFAVAMLAFTLATIGATAALFALQYRAYYAHWHGPAFSKLWTIQFVFTAAAAVAQFAISGVRLYFPLGFAALLLVSAWFARRRD
jgi:hypothetical protein